VVGLDSSPEMLERARTMARPGLRFELGRIEEATGSWDLVFSHAAIHWLSDHEQLVPRLYGLVRSSGQLVVQLPSNPDHPSRRLMAEVAAESPFVEVLGSRDRSLPVLSIERYAEILQRLGGVDLTVYEKVYPHLYADSDALLEFYRSTALKTYVDPLPVPLRDRFFERYRVRLGERYPDRPLFLGFRRILFSATKPGPST
jgi:trans-aconitate 2-methyltransferase